MVHPLADLAFDYLLDVHVHRSHIIYERPVILKIKRDTN